MTARVCGSSTARGLSRAAFESGAPHPRRGAGRLRRELSATVARSPSGQVAAWPVVASTQRDGICHEVIAPRPTSPGRWRRRRSRSRMRIARRAGRRRASSRSSCSRRGTGGARQRAGDAAAQHRALDAGRLGHQPVREPPARRAGPPARCTRLARVAWTVMVERPRRSTRPADCTTGTRTRMARDPRLRVHLYGKEVRPGRKVGHVNAYGDDLGDCLDRARHAVGGIVRGRPGRRERMSEIEAEGSHAVGIVMGSDSDWPVMKACRRGRARSSTSPSRPTWSRRTGCLTRCSPTAGREAVGRGLQGDHRRGLGSGPPAGSWRRSHHYRSSGCPCR